MVEAAKHPGGRRSAAPEPGEVGEPVAAGSPAALGGGGAAFGGGGAADEPPRDFEPSARVIVLRDFCTRARGSDCERCSLACPKRAVRFSEEGLPLVDGEACTRCGICFGICDAFSSSRVTMLDLHARIRRVALRGDEVVLTCEENLFSGLEPAANVVALPCLACLSPEFWTLVLTEKVPVSIAADLSYCSDCARAGEMAEMLYGHAVETAERWSGMPVGFLDSIPEKESLVKELADPEGLDRRAAFANLVADVGDIASGKRRLRNSEVLQQFFERRERARALARLNLADDAQITDFAPQGRTKKTMWPKRQLLLEAIDRDPGIAGRVAVTLSQTDFSRCTDSLACAAACPSGARFPDADTGALAFDARYCIGCGLCVKACPQGATSLAEASAALFLREARNGGDTGYETDSQEG